MVNHILPSSFLEAQGTRFISILSGKGGVGKSVLALNLADQLGLLGARVLLVDADFGCGNQHVLANVTVEFGIGEYASGQMTLASATTTMANGANLLAATWQEGLAEDRNVKFTAHLMARLREDTAGYDFVIFDHSSGRSNQAAMMAHASDLCLLVAIPELTSLADCYGLYKHLLGLGSSVDCCLAVNRVQSEEEASYIADKFAVMTERFLKIATGLLVGIPEDDAVRQAVAAQSTLSLVDSQAPATQALSALAALLSGHSTDSQTRENYSPITIKKHSVLADTRG